MRNIVYKTPNDITPFDYDRYLKSLQSYGLTDEDALKKGLKELDIYEPLHVSRLVKLGAQLIPDEEKAKQYYTEHTQDIGGFERLRRITGYLVGTVARWNDSKQAELKDRVKHSVSGQYTQAEKAQIEYEKAAEQLERQM